jgi:DNA-binding protein H-NS
MSVQCRTSPIGEFGDFERVPYGMELSSLSDDKISTLILDAQRELDDRRAKKHAAMLASIEARAEAMRTEALAAGLDPAAVASAFARHAHTVKRSGHRARSMSGGDGRSAVKPKYRNPKSSETWAGRGQKPEWVRAHLAKGGKLEELLIPEVAA